MTRRSAQTVTSNRSASLAAVQALFRNIATARSARRLLARLHALRDEGNSHAIAGLATVYEDGLDAAGGRVLVRADRKRARRYWNEAAALGNLAAMTRIADYLWQSRSSDNKAAAVRLYKTAARRGHATAAYNLAISYLSEAKYPRAVAWFRRAAALGDASAELQLARAQFHGRGMRRNAEAALRKLLDIARYSPWVSDFEREECLLFAANALREGWSVKRGYAESLALVREAAAIGSEAARGLLRDHGEAWTSSRTGT